MMQNKNQSGKGKGHSNICMAGVFHSLQNSYMYGIKAMFIVLLVMKCTSIGAQTISNFAGTGSIGSTGMGGPATAATFYYPMGIAADASGNIYIADYDNNFIRKVNSSGVITNYAGTGACCYGGDGGQATAASLGYPQGLAIDGSGNIYIPDTYGNRLRKISSSGIISTIAGNGTSGFSGDGGAATNATLNGILNVSVDGTGNLYFVDQNNQRVRKVNTSGVISTIAGNGTNGFLGDGGPGTAAELSNPLGIAADAAGNVYIADRDNQRIRKVNTSGIITTIAGSGSANFSGDGGQATLATLSYPTGVALDASGRVYIADADNQRIRIVSTTGIISTIVGTGTAGYSGDGGQATAANINNPQGLCVDALGYLYIADRTNERVRKVTPIPTTPVFDGGSPQSLTVCTNSTSNSFNSLLTITDPGVSLVETYSVTSAPSHGSISTGTTTTSGTSKSPSGWSYTPTSGYNGSDAFTIMVINSSGGNASLTINVTINPLPTVGTTGSGTICSGTTATLSGTGATSYIWSGGITNGVAFTPAIGTNVYTVTGTSSGCTNAATAIVIVNTIPTVGSTGGGSICSGSTATLSGTGATSYSWTGGITNGAAFTPSIGTNIYTVTGTTAGCSSTTTATVTVNPLPTVGATGAGTICSGTTATLSGTGATSYIWSGGISNGVAFAPAVGANTYTVTGTTSGCSNRATATVIVNALPSVGATGSAIICNGNMATLRGIGATTYSWSGGITDGVAFTPSLGTNIYTVTGTTSGCSSTATATVIVNAIPTVGSTGGGTICSGATATLNGTGATSYSWSGGIINGVAFTPSVGTNIYTVTGTISGCSNTSTATVIVNALPIVGTIGGGTICSGTTATLSGIGATSYVWSGGITNGVAFTPSAGTNIYTVTGTASGCSNTATATVIVNALPTVGSTGGGTICSGSTATLSGTGATSYSWTGGITNGVAFNPPVGTNIYTVTGTSSGCSNTATASVIVNALPTVGTTGGGTICSGATATLNGTGAVSYSWSGGITNGVAFTPSVGTNDYTVTGTASGCNNTSTATIIVNALPTVGTLGGGSICSGNTATLSGTGAISYSWTGGITNGVAFTPSLGTSVYTVTGTTTGCSNTAIATITLNPLPMAIGAGIISTIAGNGTSGFNIDGISSTTAKLNSPQGVAVDAGGNIYIADVNNNRIRKINTSGIISTVAGTGTSGFSGDGSNATAARLSTPCAVYIDGSGNIFIADNGNNRIRKVNSSGIISTVAGNGTLGFNSDGIAATSSQLNYPTGVTVDGSGNIYIADNNNNRIRMVNSAGIISTVAGNGTAGYLGDGVAATATRLSSPFSVAVDGSGNIYIGDNSNNRIRKVNASGVISTILSGTGGPGLGVDAGGNVYVGDVVGSLIRKITPAGVITTISGTGTGGFSGDGGAATAAQVNGTFGVAAGADGSIYLADTYNQRIRKISGGPSATSICAGTPISLSDLTSGGTWSASNANATISAGVVTGVSAGIDTISYTLGTGCSSVVTITVNALPAISGSGFSYCSGGSGSLTLSGASGYNWSPATGLSATTGASVTVSSSVANTYTVTGISSVGCSNTAVFITTVNPLPSPIGANSPNRNKIITIAGNGSATYGGDGGSATDASIHSPAGVCIDASGNMYIAELSSNRVRKVSPSGIISTIAGTGTAGFTGDSGPATLATLNNVADVAVDGTGNVYIVDVSNHRIRKVNTSGVISTIAGTASAGYNGDNIAATSATLYYPWGLALDAAGNIYIADQYNHRVRKVNTSGIISTVAGNGTAGFSGDGSSATSANLNYPSGISIDANGNMYIADGHNQRIRKVYFTLHRNVQCFYGRIGN